MKHGYFIVLDGVDGTGKTTQAKLLVEVLRQRGHSVLLTREPGGTALAETIRKLLLNPKHKLNSLSELFLYEAARAQHTQEVILPALDKGETVICERYTSSTLAYQGYGRGLNLKIIERLNQLATLGINPDLTLILDLPPQQGQQRIRWRNSKKRTRKDRLEQESISFHQRVRRGFHQIARRRPRRIFIITARGSIENTHRRILSIIDKHFSSKKREK